MIDYKNFVNNKMSPAESAEAMLVDNPVNGNLVGQVYCASKEQAQLAVESAARAQVAWRALPGVERAAYLHRLADAIVARASKIGQVLALESGKSIEDATNEALSAAEITRYHAEWGRRIEGEIIPSDTPSENLMLYREPIGVVACLIPFNYPVYTLLRKIAPALITGNTVVVRPSNSTPLSAFEIAQAIVDAGMPAGVINILAMNHEIAEQLCTHPKVGMITLTGSVNAGRKVLQYSQQNIAKSSLELGGKTPAIIASDADLEKAATDIVLSKTTHCGQLCTAVERVYVNSAVALPLIALLKKKMAERTWGSRLDNPANMGPLISNAAREKIHAMVLQAISDGATLLTGGFIPPGAGYFYPPTLLTNCRQSMEIVQQEIFGPVLCVLEVDTEQQALELANDHQYGLSSVLYTENYRTVMLFSNNIEAGELYINRMPADPYQGFHAGWKRSGLGGDDGKHGMLEYTQTRLVVMNY